MALALPSLSDRVRDLVISLQLNLTLDPASLILQACVVALLLALLLYIGRLQHALQAELHHRRQQRWASLVRAALDAHAASGVRTRPTRHEQAFRHPKPSAPPAEEDPYVVPEPLPPTWRPTAKARGRAAAAAPVALGYTAPPPATASPPASLLPLKPEPPPKKGTQPVPCPRCNSFLLQRSARRGGWFWGCPRWPECRGTRPLAEGQAIRDGLRPASSQP